MKSGYLYFLQSKKDQSLYFGSTNNVQRRLQEHNDGKSASTRPSKPWELICSFEFPTIQEARRMEQLLKSHKTKISREWLTDTLVKYTEKRHR